MIAPSKIRAAKAAPNRASRVRLMAETMRHHAAGPEAGCTDHHLSCAGFSSAEIAINREAAIELLRDQPPIVLAPSCGRIEGQRLVRIARVIRKRVDARMSS